MTACCPHCGKEIDENRSKESHRHFFGRLHEYWQNLPEHLGDRFPTEESLRHWALIKAGYRNETHIVADSKREVSRIALLADQMNPYSVVLIDGLSVSIFTAKSQTRKAMLKQEFEQSKADVLRVCAELCGVW